MDTPRILVIDDDSAIIKLMEIFFKRTSYDVEYCKDGSQAQDFFTNKNYDLVLTDLLMPRFDGIRFVKWLRNEQNSKIPVIVVSSVKDEAKLAILKEHDIVAFFRKPFDINELLKKIGEII